MQQNGLQRQVKVLATPDPTHLHLLVRAAAKASWHRCVRDDGADVIDLAELDAVQDLLLREQRGDVLRGDGPIAGHLNPTRMHPSAARVE